MLHVIPCADSFERLQVHLLLEKRYPDMPKRSMYISSFETDGCRLFKHTCRCGPDKLIRITPADYSKGTEGNNKDESYSLYCEQCDENISWEPNYDDGVYTPRRNNAIIYGVCVLPKKKYTPRGPVDNTLQREVKVYEIAAPSADLMRDKNKLSEYITQKISYLNTSHKKLAIGP